MRWLVHVLVVVSLAAVSVSAVGCSPSDRPYAFGGDPNQSPGTSPVGSVTGAAR